MANNNAFDKVRNYFGLSNSKLEEERQDLEVQKNEVVQLFEAAQKYKEEQANLLNSVKQDKLTLENERVRLDNEKQVLEIEKNANDELKLSIEEKLNTLNSRLKEQNSKELELQKRELDAENNFPTLYAEKLNAFKEDIQKKIQELSEREETLNKKEIDLSAKEAEAVSGYINKISQLNDEIKNLKENLEQVQSDKINECITNLKKAEEHKENEIEQRFKDQISHLKEEYDLKEKDLKSFYELKTQELNTRKQELENKNKNLEKEREELNKFKAECDEAKLKAEQAQQKYEKRFNFLKSREDDFEERKLEEANIFEQDKENLISQRMSEERAAFNLREEEYKNQIKALHNKTQNFLKLQNIYEQLESTLGSDPSVFLTKLDSLQEKNNKLTEELNSRASVKQLEEMKAAVRNADAYKNRVDELTRENIELNNKITELSVQEIQSNRIAREREEFMQDNQYLKARNNQLEEDLKRLTVSYQPQTERAERIKNIFENPLIEVTKNIEFLDPNYGEISWLNYIDSCMKNIGLKFSKRILNAFHTSLKISDWSSIVVLAGVSGTGKSELPRCYSLFGGINFCMLAVQPNWDSQESMLGFFNSIDNKFDAQPALRFLVQSQTTRIPLDSENINYAEMKGPNGLKDCVNLVLLDEMNLAHVELYFAEFLSKLESRRGNGRNTLPNVEVKLGTGLKPLEVPLGRNVLWVGTMNQDETTKSLSDKVLDRGVVIHFPRPRSLESRTMKQLLPNQKLLNIDTWNNWVYKIPRQLFDKQDSDVAKKNKELFNKLIKPCKELVEEINDCMFAVGRAVGHRVWQAIEAYIKNYPTVIDAFMKNKSEKDIQKEIHIAFEDQIVQKIMPKLRGLETRGRTRTECLDKIKALLNNNGFNLNDDFDRAMELGYGQFMWCSAEYLNSAEASENTEEA